MLEISREWFHSHRYTDAAFVRRPLWEEYSQEKSWRSAAVRWRHILVEQHRGTAQWNMPSTHALIQVATVRRSQKLSAIGQP